MVMENCGASVRAIAGTPPRLTAVRLKAKDLLNFRRFMNSPKNVSRKGAKAQRKLF
jgi:hypothetical protein